MWLKNFSMAFFITVLSGGLIFAQKPIVPKDSAHLYKKIESYSNRSRFTKFIYPMIFKSTKDSSKKIVKPKGYQKLVKFSYKPFEGKTIRQIHIETLDPFGYSITDTLSQPKNFLEKSGNKLHIKTKKVTIRNLLLIKRNQVFDSLLMKESERLIRKNSYVRDVLFRLEASSQKLDSVDIYISVLDNWTIIPEIGISSSRYGFKLTDRNFSGLGHESQNAFQWIHSSDNFAYKLNYMIPNFKNTFVQANINFLKDEFRNTSRNFAIDRPFFSPFAKWAAGFSFEQQTRIDSVLAPNMIYNTTGVKFNLQDYWAGWSFQLFKGNSENARSTNLISTFRFLRIRYLEKPFEWPDPTNIYSDENFYLVGVGLSTRKYVQDRFIFRYGLTEDVPVGKVISLTAGYQKKNQTGRLYIGSCFSFGNYYRWGYLSPSIEFGIFIHPSLTKEMVFSAGVNYFSGLFEIGNWKFRQFLKPKITIGFNRSLNDSLTINESSGLEGFNSILLSGTRRLLVTFQTQSYSPWRFFGFRFGPYVACSFGMLGNASNGFKNSKLYSLIGFGFLLKNDYLVFNTFQISIAFYPIIPGKGTNIIKLNPLRTSDFGFRDFEIGKPAVVQFQ
jgi:hypothetical protein